MPTAYLVEPQRSDGRGYVPCELHQATSFACIEHIVWTSRGKKLSAKRVIKRCPTRNAAILEAEAMTRRKIKLPGYKLGRRIIKEGF